MEEQELPYEFSFIGGNENAYLFETRSGIVYQVKFTPTPYLFTEEPRFAEHTFELSLLVSQNPTGRLPTYDRRTARTLAAILSEFYKRSDKTIALYICASEDGRQLLRERLFRRWFDFFDQDDYYRIDGTIRDEDGTSYPVAFILKQGNPFGPEIAAAFMRIIGGYESGK